nr:WGR domain-containing protein [Paracoccus saliphilus]
MHVRLEKIVPAKRQRRFYVVSIAQTLFGEWCVRREWGRIGAAGGQQAAEYLPTREEAEEVLQRHKLAKCRRGYAPIPVQLRLF